MVADQSLNEAIKSQARLLGFQLVGITTPDPPPHFATYERWLEAGRHGEMAYLASERARQRRADPRHILPECRSILVLGIRYPAPEEGGDHPAGKGCVAAYAWGDDYHNSLAERLRRLVAFIEAQVGNPVPNRWYTDTGPILERDLAQRAGLGWIGKNTCLIAPQLGSYFFLAEVLLGIDLEPDPPFLSDYCGSCTRCLEACPTACILLDRTLDASRCVSYLTIELKGTIPSDLRQSMGSWVFGCDVCQQVCPWNRRFAAPEGDTAFAPRRDVPAPDLARELSLTPKDFNQKFYDSPVRRAKRRGYLRNVAVALGNQRSTDAIAGLVKALLGESEPLVRQHAAWALGQIGGETVRRELQLTLRTEMDESVRLEIRQALKAK
jgi:epoxyqueuosine reductase